MAAVSVRPRFISVFGVLTIIVVSIWGLKPVSAQDDFSCATSSRVFSGSGSRMLTDDLKKLSRAEFILSPVAPTRVEQLPAGTQLNVLIDLDCLRDSTRGARDLGWLKGVRDSQVGLKYRGERSFVWRLQETVDFGELQNTFESESCVRMVSPNGVYRTQGLFDDPLLARQDHLRFLRFDKALRDFFVPMLARKSVVIAIIDSGVDFRHPDLYANRWVNKREVSGNNRDDDSDGHTDDVNGYNFASEIGDPGPQGDQPESRHGTHVAGLAAARVDNGTGGAGINGVAQIMSLNIFGPNNTTRSALLENAIRYAADQGADIINMSLGGREYSRTMRSALEYAISRGTFIVTAAGNYGIEICDDPGSFGYISPAIYASSMSGMMVTGSVDASSGRLSGFSNYSDRLVEIVAPGAYISATKVGLLSTFPGGTYAYLSGTSMAAPILSGAAALVVNWLKVYGYPVSPQTIELALREGARTDPKLLSWVQAGRTLDLAKLASYLKKNYPPRSKGPLPPPSTSRRTTLGD